MVKLIKKIKEKNEMNVGSFVTGFCEWGGVHYFEFIRTDSWKCEEAVYDLYIEAQGHDPKRFAINLTGSIDSILETLEAIDNIYIIEEEDEDEE